MEFRADMEDILVGVDSFYRFVVSQISVARHKHTLYVLVC